MNNVEKKLKDAKGRYRQIVIVGMEKEGGNIHVDTSLNNILDVQYMLNRASLEAIVFQMKEENKLKEASSEENNQG